MNRHTLDKESINKTWSISVVLILLLSSLLATLSILYETQNAEAEPSSNPIGTITGAVDDRYFGWNVSTAGDINDDGYDDVIVGAPYSGIVVEASNWWNDNWTYRRRLTFDNSGQNENLTNFPVMVNLNPTNFDYAKANLDASDLRFIDPDGVTELTYHIEEWNLLGDSYIWVNVTKIDGNSNSDYMWMYYNNSAAPNSVDVWGTYDSDFVGVWHLNDSVGPVRDSTVNGHDGTALGGVDRGFTGMVGGAFDFAGDDDYMDFGNDPQLMITGNVTLEAWIDIDTDPATYDYAIMQLGDSGETEAENWLYLLVLTPGGAGLDVDIGHEYGDGIDEKRTYDANLQLDTWYHLAATRDVSVNEWRLYINGVQFDTPFVYANAPSGGSLGNLMVCMDWFNLAWRFTDGTMDELRISSSPRSADWISAQYLSMTNNFITFGFEEKKNGTCGAAYIFFGGPGIMGDITAGNANITINGSALNDKFGWSIAVGNVVGDNTTDILVGAPGYDGGQNIGAVYLFDGDMLSADTDGRLIASESTNIITGESLGDEFGSAVSGAGDVNNDSYDDLIVGAPEYGSLKGRAYIFFGDGSIPTNASDADVFLAGVSDNSRFGHSVSCAGDMNGDGNCDVMVGAPGENKAYIYFGGVNLITTLIIKPETLGPLDDTNSNIDDIKLDDDSYYNVPKNGKIMFLDSFNVSNLSGRVTNAILYAQYYTGANYDVTGNYIQWALDGQPLSNSSIEITISDPDVRTPEGYNLFEQGIDTPEKLETLDISFTNNATGGNKHVCFDYIWIEVTTNTVEPVLILDGSMDFGWSLSNGGDVNGDDVGDVIIGAPDLTGGTSGKAYVKYGNFQGFDNETTGATPLGWQQIGAGTNNALVSENASFGSGGKSIEFNWTGGDLAEIRKVFPSAQQGDKGVVEFCVRVSEIDNDKFYIIIGNTTSGNWTLQLGFGSSIAGEEDYIRYYEGNGDGTGMYYPLQPYTPDTWYHVRVLSDSTTNTWDLYIDGILKVSDIGFVSDNTIPNYISFHQFNAGNPHVDYVDNVVWFFNNLEVMITGESNGNQFGYSVADAGNLNGDSFDDIIVGAPKANGNGSVYVFHGNDSWKSVISAATANITLTGEYASDSFGWSVSNAGDVNNDGLGNIIIGAPNFDDGFNTDAGKAYIFFGPNITYQPDLWINGSIDNVYQTMPGGAQLNTSLISEGENSTWWIALQNDGSVNDTFNFSITVNMLPGWTWQFTENGTGKVINDGDFIYLASGESINYTLNISSPLSTVPLDESWVEIVVKSQNGTTYDSVKAIARISGDLPPEISDVQAIPDPQETGGSVNITCNVTDNIGVSEVWVNITLPGGGDINATMGKGTGDLWFYKNVYVPLGLYLYTIWAKDTSGYWNSSSGHSFNIQDTSLPKITMVLEIPDPQETGGFVNISCEVTDNVMVDEVWVNFTLPGGGITNVSMYPGAADQWFLNTTYTPLGPYQFTIWANDTSGNWNFSSGHSFLIQDTSLPVISDLSIMPNNQYIGGYVNISGNITDDSGIFGVWVNITLPGGGYDNQTLIQGSTNHWFHNNTYTIPGGYLFTIWANDTAGNWNKSSIFTFEVFNREPQLSLCQVNPSVGYNDTWFNFTATYTDLDNHAPDKITVNITNMGIFDMLEVDPLDIDCTDGKAYYFNISGFKNGTSYSFHFAANDTIGNWTKSAEILGPQVLNTPPTLLSPSINPISGMNTTYFNFTVTYLDIDNHPPNNITLNLTGLSGGTFDLLEVDPSDTDYSDGKEYYYNTTLSNGAYSFHFAVNDSLGLWYETSEINAPLVGISEPILTGSGVTPISGYIDTWFNFTVNYSHPFNKGPDNMTLNLTGPSGGIFDLVEVDPSDVDYTDGKLFYLNITGLDIGLYSFHFAANDSDGNWSVSGILGFEVFNRPPSLSAPQLNPTVGYIDTGFNFTVVYRDFDNHAPDNITVNITNFGTFTMMELDPGDINFIDGKIYFLNLSGFLNDTSYSYHFSANDSEGQWVETIETDGPTVYDTSPTLTSPSVNPVSGYTNTWFNFTVNYTDLDNHAADDITVNITGMGYFELLELDPNDLDFTDGKWYYINLTGFVNGTSYSYHFAAKNIESEWVETPELSGPVVFSSPPVLTFPSVNPISGYIGTWFNFTVNYTNIDNHAPNTISINITNYGIVNLSELGSGDLDYTDGKWYYVNLTGFVNGTSYSYHFATNDSGGAWVETIETGGPFIYNLQPLLTSPLVNPLVGYTDTGFNFTVTYTDLDNHAPDTITVNITGLGVYALMEVNPFDMDYTDGKSYYVNISGIPLGTSYTFHFAANDTTGDWVEGPEIEGPDVINRAPSLTLEQVNPNTGFLDTWFNFSVVYTDLDNSPPDSVTVNITGVGIIDLIEVDSLDMDYSDGKTYYYNMSGIAIDQHTFYFAANDTIGNWTETGNLQFEVLNRDPTLSTDVVDPTTGFIDTWFNFTVVYTDLDDHPPDIITVNITGLGIYDLIEVDSLDMDYSDGKEYYYIGSGIAIGQYSFHFAANDTMGDWTESTSLQFEVVNRAPELSADGVNPATGYTDTAFNFTVIYTDLDGHAPDIITVNITGLGIYDLVEGDPSDSDYTDGKSYYFNLMGMPEGTSYTFHFSANDTLGDWAIETSEINAPDVSERFATLTSYDKTVKYSDDVVLNATLSVMGISIIGANVAFFIDKNDNGSYEAEEQVGDGQTLPSGVASISYTALLTPGDYSYLAVYMGTIYSVPNSEATVVVTPKPGTITTFHKVIEEGQSAMLNASLKDEDGNRLSNHNIEFYVDRNQDSYRTGSELVGSDETDINGYIEVFDLKISRQLKTGTYSIWAVYRGSGNYSVTEGQAILIVQNTTNKPPEIVSTVPDQIIEEDSPPWELDLTSYESDTEDSGEDLTWYLTGVNTSLYTVTGMNSTDDVFTFIPVANAFGNDEVTLWLVDSSGGITSQTLWINITPVNDRPKIEAINPITVHFDAEYTYIFTNYVNDIETPKEDLVLTTNKPEYTTVNGLKITFLYPESWLNKTDNVRVTVTDTDGGSTSTIVIVKVTDDWVPELEVEIPDVTLYEGETISNVFDLDDYFSDPDGDALFYVTDNEHVTINIDSITHVVNMTAPKDWFGEEIVIFHALDPKQARVEDFVIITVLPVNDVPSISGVPDLVVRFDQDYIFNLKPYVYDEDNADVELILSFIDPDTGLAMPGVRIDPNNNLGMIINLPEAMNGSTIQLLIRVLDGLDSNFTTINITVSDDYPPELIMQIPDISFEEDTTLVNAFNISHYFLDFDDDFLVYTSGQEMTNVTINLDGFVDFSAFLNWFGMENVTFRATDEAGALVEYTITVTVIPVNDAPTIAQVPDQSGEEGKIWVLDIRDLLFDIDNDLDDLVVTVDSDYVEAVGHTLIFTYPKGVEEDTVTVTVSDGALNSSVTFSVTISKVETPSPGPLLLDYILWIILIPLILSALILGFILYKRKVEAPFVDEVFLISNDGTLIAHTSMRFEEEIDKDLLSGMLTGVKNLISDAFAREKKGIKDESLHKLEFGERNILLEKGNYFFIAVVFSGKENKSLLDKIQDVIQRFEEKYKDVFGKWKGDMVAFEGAGEVIEPLLSLEKLSEEEREQLLEARKKRKEAEESALEELQEKLMNLALIEDLEELEDIPPPPDDWEG